MVKKTCSIDWSNGEDLTCIAFASNEGGKAHLTKVLYLTPEETALMRAALQAKESPADSPASPVQQLKAKIPQNIIERLEAVQCIVASKCDKTDAHCAYDELDNIIAELSAV